MSQYRYIIFFLVFSILFFPSCGSGNDDIVTNSNITGTWEITSQYIISSDKETEKRINTLFVLFMQENGMEQTFTEVEKGTGITRTYIFNKETQEEVKKRQGEYTISSNSLYINEGYALEGTCTITSNSMEQRFPVTRSQLDPIVREIGGDVHLTPEDIQAVLVITQIRK